MAITVETGFPNTNIPGILRSLQVEKKNSSLKSTENPVNHQP